ncbi:OmpH family outer membrane protein [Parerythrobacter aestuarii]|uniref:OmpH family outer membrane protein n=1 Tax=Parerythrobacter aestuarii TaxID=3020909 RepID=UPI0024DEA6E3|nr:OmpH family outer membrane protein [Parerythrobacter aestuarii]
MKLFTKTSLATALALGATAAIAVPAHAQVAGIATSSPEATILQSQARINAYQQISTTYAAQIQQITTMRNEINTLQQGLDTNGDRTVTQAEIDAQPAVWSQIEAKEQQVEQVSMPILMAQYYVLEQLLERYGAAQNQVIQQKNIQIMLTPEAFQYAAEGANVTPDILAALNTMVPTVTTTPPSQYQPRRDVVQLHQTIQQLIIAAARQQAATQQAQGAQQPAPQQPSGR